MSVMDTFRAGIAADTDDCILWPHGKNSRGYGVLRYEGKMQFVHRVACDLSGITGDGEMVLHACDNRACFNPRHLRRGTAAQNSGDMTARHRQAVGEAINHAKLTTESVAEMRRLRAAGLTLRALGDRFGVSEGNVSLIVNGRTWA